MIRIKSQFLGNWISFQWRTLLFIAFINKQISFWILNLNEYLCVFLQSYHHWEGEGDDVDGPQRAEAGQDGQEQVVSRLGPVHSGFCDGTGLAGERGPWWARTNRAGPAAQTRPTVSVTARLSVKFGRHRGHCGRRVDPDGTDAVTWRRRSLQRMILISNNRFHPFTEFCLWGVLEKFEPRVRQGVRRNLDQLTNRWFESFPTF